MKRKSYKVKIKVVFEDTLYHSHYSKQKAMNEVKSVYMTNLANAKDIKKIFDKPPRIIISAEKRNYE